MAATIEVNGAHGRAVFEVLRHGQKRPWRRVAVDVLGRECRPALMTRDGVFLPAGTMAPGYQDADGNDADRLALLGCDGVGRIVASNKGRSHGVLQVDEVADASELLDFIVERVDRLLPVSIDEGLKRSLDAGTIYCAEAKPLFLLANTSGMFLTAFMLAPPMPLLLDPFKSRQWEV